MPIWLQCAAIANAKLTELEVQPITSTSPRDWRALSTKRNFLKRSRKRLRHGLRLKERRTAHFTGKEATALSQSVGANWSALPAKPLRALVNNRGAALLT